MSEDAPEATETTEETAPNPVSQNHTYSEDFNQTPMKNAQIAFIINVSDVNTLGEAMDVGALNLIRWGLNDFYVTVTNTDTNEDYIVVRNRAFPASPDLMADIAEFMRSGDQGEDDDVDEVDEDVDDDEPRGD